ncbi:putative fatty acyl-CoA reductase [Pseudolycoriella hygida]|uniref:Fatty acyl-CoA reductase n=1 Tax=Pseudolycoriella hygida TaxID=35572 RepID=A0A9Q0MY63_9DIPT|nr:putative fatty acyl-CoA reductase [Pseudolycoriella hygida]
MNTNMTEDDSIPTIPEFFKGRDIFITGVLIEKLLRSCPDLNRIFILVRPKKNQNIQERIAALQNLPIFDIIKDQDPKNLDKMIPIKGDVTEIGLGLSEDDKLLMADVSVVFHSAASVRFDDPLHEAVIMNTRGTRELMLFAETLTKLMILVHVSTTYFNPRQSVVCERMYPPNGDWKGTIKLAEQYPEILDVLTEKYINYEPNTYTFTKGLAEQVAIEFQDRLPIIIYRPSIVISALEEPIPGWIDNFNGPVGLLIACALGILRTTHGDPDIVSDFTPVDTSIKAMIVAAWKRGTKPTSEKIVVYNCSTSLQRKFTTGFIIQMGENLSSQIPMDKMLWKPGGSITKCRYDNFIKFILYHLCTAYVVDTIFKILGRKQFLVKLQRRIYGANLALQHFIRTHWVFENDCFLKLHNEIKSSDLSNFRYDNFVTADVREYFLHCILGARRYLLHEKDENLPRARRNYRRMNLIDKVVKTVLYSGIIYFAFIRSGAVAYILGL